MFFILRAIFWLAVVSAFLPAREDHAEIPVRTVQSIAETAIGYCSQHPDLCASTARAGAEALSIPSEFFVQIQKYSTEPSHRPASL